jgi:hypothetical protein
MLIYRKNSVVSHSQQLKSVILYVVKKEIIRLAVTIVATVPDNISTELFR